VSTISRSPRSGVSGPGAGKGGIPRYEARHSIGFEINRLFQIEVLIHHHHHQYRQHHHSSSCAPPLAHLPPLSPELFRLVRRWPILFFSFLLHFHLMQPAIQRPNTSIQQPPSCHVVYTKSSLTSTYAKHRPVIVMAHWPTKVKPGTSCYLGRASRLVRGSVTRPIPCKCCMHGQSRQV
jgi:hypothetical protein